jgi:hypothetical protein
MKIFDRLEKLTEKMKMLETIMLTTQNKTSPKMERMFRSMESMDRVNNTVKQAQQIQQLMSISTGKKNKTSVDNTLPLLAMIISNLAAEKSTTQPSDDD